METSSRDHATPREGPDATRTSRKQSQRRSSTTKPMNQNKEGNDNKSRQRASLTGRKGTKTNNQKINHDLGQPTTTLDSRSPKRRSRRSTSRDRVVNRDRGSSGGDCRCENNCQPGRRRAGSLPKKMKTHDRKPSRSRRESDAVNHQSKKKPNIRRTRSYESLTATASDKKHRCAPTNKHETTRSVSPWGVPIPNERRLPMTSIGCPAAASLKRTSSPNNVDTANFDFMYAQELQMEECARIRRRPRLEQRYYSGTNLSSRSLEDHHVIPNENDKKPAAKARSKSTKRSSRKEERSIQNNIVPLNPEESTNYLRKKYSSEARAFVQRLKSLIGNETASSQRKNFFSAVLTDEELEHLVASMFQMQSTFANLGKESSLDIGYHFCRGDNIKRIQTQPGLWSKIQAKGVNKSQDGDGIYTINSPQLSKANQANSATNDGDVWMAVARLQGNKRSNAFVSQRSWNNDEDSLVQAEGEVVVLKSPTQFFPLVQFQTSLLRAGSAADAFFLEMQQGLEILVDDFFNNRKTASLPEKTQAGERSLPVYVGPKTLCHSAAEELASDIRAVLEEYMVASSAAISGFGDSVLAIQSIVEEAEMSVLADNMFRTQKRFKESNKPAYIDIGYHYCRGENLRKMQPGFWSSIQSRGFNKSEDGDGIYTFNDPLGTRTRNNRPGSFFDMRQSVRNDDDVWFLVARIQGDRQSSAPGSNAAANSGRKWDNNVDAMIWNGRHSDEVVVLRTSAQFFPLLQFPAKNIDAKSGHEETLQGLQMIHQRLQGILDKFFNCRIESRGDSIDLEGKEETLDYCAPDALDWKTSTQGSGQIYKILSNNKKASNDDCSVCLDSLRAANHLVVRLRNCGHEFHLSCLHEVFANQFELCPICNQPVATGPRACLQGLSPSATMAVTTASHTFCERVWAPKGSLVLSFFIPSGLQKEYMANPGQSYPSAFFRSFLPNNKSGTKLLRRLQYAFLHGLLFAVSARNENQDCDFSIVLASISLKMSGSTSGSSDFSHEFPNPEDLEVWNNELDRCGVPDYASCQEFIFQEINKARNGSQVSPHQTSMSPEENAECFRILKGLKSHRHGWLFCKVLPPIENKVESPMDFTTIENKLTAQAYASVSDYQSDVLLIFQNAMCWHSKENPIHYMAKTLKRKFRKDLRHLMEHTTSYQWK